MKLRPSLAAEMNYNLEVQLNLSFVITFHLSLIE